jgi:hypothetical protein
VTRVSSISDNLWRLRARARDEIPPAGKSRDELSVVSSPRRADLSAQHSLRIEHTKNTVMHTCVMPAPSRHGTSEILLLVALGLILLWAFLH